MAKPEKTICAISLATFKTDAKPLIITIEDGTGQKKQVVVPVKEFATGSFGWYLNDKVTVMVGDKAIPVQIGANLIAVGSKEADRK